MTQYHPSYEGINWILKSMMVMTLQTLFYGAIHLMSYFLYCSYSTRETETCSIFNPNFHFIGIYQLV
jgi:hypothetical protein